MLRRFFAVALLCLAGSIGQVHAQSSPVILPGGCGTASYTYETGYFTIDSTGRLCGASTTTGTVVSHAASSGLVNNLSVKASSGNLYGFNCTGIAGAAAGFCVAYAGATTPGTGALTAANVLDYCYFDTTARGCSLTHAPNSVAYSGGIQILVTSAASPFTYTTGTDTAAVSADYQ
jgi:hypothetical protein